MKKSTQVTSLLSHNVKKIGEGEPQQAHLRKMKLQGPRNEFASYRGIFRVSIFRAILDRLIYNDEYPNLDTWRFLSTSC